VRFTNRRLSHEIAERKGGENAQRESEARYRAIFANTADVSVIDLGADGVFRMAEVNPAYEGDGVVDPAACAARKSPICPPSPSCWLDI